MQHAETVIQFPADRASVRRRAHRDAEANRPWQENAYSARSDQLAYEHAYHERARQLDGEIAECA